MENRSSSISGLVEGETDLLVGTPRVFGSQSPSGSFNVTFEDDGDTGYLYALDFGRENPMLDAMHIYTVDNITDKDKPSIARFAWSTDGLKAAFLINEYVHAVFDFAGKRGYCRTGFPPSTEWSEAGHEWSDEALSFFK